jgi:hypothetical protein
LSQICKQYILWEGRLVSLQFPYLQALFQQRPRHRMDDFEFHHPPMERGKRAKIFAPYDALDGYSASVKKKNTEYVDRIFLDEGQKEELNRRLSILHVLTRTARLAKKNRVIVTATYYVPCADEHSFAYQVKGQYLTVSGAVRKVDGELTRTLTVGDTVLSFDDLLSVEAEDETLFQERREE